MKIAGIVAEFNPFHTGHKYLLDKAREMGFSHIVVCLSSDLTQRGDLAVFDKRARAVSAIQNGADLVLELPFPFSMSCAEVYAKKSVEILKSVGIDALIFGCETVDKQLLLQAAKESVLLKEDSEVSSLVKSGESYPAAAYSVLERKAGKQIAQIFKNPNATLAIEYIKSLGDTPFFPVLRTSPHNSDKLCEFASASKLRTELRQGNSEVLKYLPYKIPDSISDITKIERAIILSLCQIDKASLLEISDVNEDIANRLINASKKATTLDELLNLSKTKAYTMSRIKRCVMNTYLGVRKEDLSLPVYVRPIAANDRGIEILSRSPVKAEASLKAIEKTHPRLARLSCLVDRLYDMCLEKPCGSNEYTKPFIKL
ncbi:MAG: nucleotidyltransferase family protein [Ruminococcus sp.]|nr:nucleotidyltransferase family protein [Ruminococcus sp.]